MHGDPSQTESGDQEPLGQPTAGEDGDILRQGGDRDEGVTREDHVLVNLVRNNWEAGVSSDIYHLTNVLLIVHGATWVAGVVVHDGHRLSVDLLLYVCHIVSNQIRGDTPFGR